MDARVVKEQFLVHGDSRLEENKKKGILRLSLPLQFIHTTKFIIRYFTYEERYSYLHDFHFKTTYFLDHHSLAHHDPAHTLWP